MVITFVTGNNSISASLSLLIFQDRSAGKLLWYEASHALSIVYVAAG